MLFATKQHLTRGVVSALLLLSVLISMVSAGTINYDGQSKRLLVLLDTLGIRETHSTFFKSLKDRGFQITYKTADDSELALSKYNEYLYDHLILFSPNVAEFGGNVSTKAIVDFVDAGGNLLVAVNSQINDPVKEIAGECGFEFSDEGTYVIDHFNTATGDDGRNTLIISEPENLIGNKLIVDNAKNGAPFLYRGVGINADPENPLILEILTASPSAYTYNPQESITEYPHSVGKNTLLISGIQARNNARAVFVGSLDFFSNEFFESAVQKSAAGSKRSDKSGNEQLSLALTQWVFKEKGVLRVSGIKHYRVGEKSAPVAYTIKQNIVYSIQIEENVNGKWQPFQGNDVQLEFVRLDPFVRTTLTAAKNGNFEAKFQIPDVYGIFKFVVDYKRVGYTYLFSSTQVSVRPLQHTEYDRFIPAAFPYYASTFAMMAGVFLFSFIQLYHTDAPQTVAKKD